METVLHSFAGSPTDGNAPNGLTNVNGTLYGTTYAGGTHGKLGAGTVFSITTSGVETIVYSFALGRHGHDPQAGLTAVGNVLYGTAYDGGASGDGTVFKITTSGEERQLYGFGGGPNDGANPEGLVDVNGTLYGTTFAGGANSNGTVFKLSEKGLETILYSFRGGTDGADPGDLFYLNGMLYGMTSDGGGSGCVQGSGCGTIFEITTAGVYHQLHRFGNKTDGKDPLGGLVNVGGRLYGTTAFGGAYAEGTVFRITTSGKEKVLYNFCQLALCADGTHPYAGLLNVNGTLYGTTNSGGASSDDGTVFAITTDGAFSLLYSFGESPYDGRAPSERLTELNGTLYGTTFYGGTYLQGTVFSLSGF